MIAALMSSVRTPESSGFSARMRSTSTPSARLAAAPLGHGEAAHEVVGGVQQHDRLLVGDAPDDAAGDLGVFLIFFREECVGRLSAVPAHHLPAAVVELAHERQVGEPLLLDALRELRDAGLVHRVGGVGGVICDFFDGSSRRGSRCGSMRSCRAARRW